MCIENIVAQCIVVYTYLEWLVILLRSGRLCNTPRVQKEAQFLLPRVQILLHLPHPLQQWGVGINLSKRLDKSAPTEVYSDDT